MKAIITILLMLPLLIMAQISVDNNSVTLDGTVGITITDSQWNDLVVTGTASRINPTVSRPVFNYDSMAVAIIRDGDSSDIIYYQYQLPHNIEYGTTVTISPHFHYMQYAVADTTFEIVIMVRIQELGATQGAFTRYMPTHRAALTYSGTAGFHQICEFPSVTLNNVCESSYIDIKFYRKDAGGNPATVWLLGFDLHIPLISFGSLDEYPTH